MDPLNKPHQLHAIEFEDIPAPEEHRRQVRRIFRVCGTVAACFLVSAVVGITLAVRSGVPLAVIAAVAVMSSFICIVTFGIGYACPVGLVSLLRLEIAYKMGYFGLDLNRNTASSIRDVADQIRVQAPKPLVAARRPVQEG